jgi:hypothetical protein
MKTQYTGKDTISRLRSALHGLRLANAGYVLGGLRAQARVDGVNYVRQVQEDRAGEDIGGYGQGMSGE